MIGQRLPGTPATGTGPRSTRWHGTCCGRVMRSSERGATTVEYVLLVTVVVVPSVAVFVVGFVRVYLWYVSFVTTVGQPTP